MITEAPMIQVFPFQQLRYFATFVGRDAAVSAWAVSLNDIDIFGPGQVLGNNQTPQVIK